MASHSLGCLCASCVQKKRHRASVAFQSPVISGGVPRKASAASAGYPTAEVGGHESPPLGNTGETYKAPTTETVELVVDGGKIKQVTIRRPSSTECAVIDTLRFTIHQDTFLKTNLLNVGPAAGSTIISDEDFVIEASRIFSDIFGFGVSRFTGKGRDFYRDAYVLGEAFGHVCIGNAGKNNQKGTMLIELNGLGCINAASGWEKRLYHFLSAVAVRPSLTRVDVAHDDFEGARVTPDWAEAQWLSGGFTKCVGKDPNIERAGNWHKPTGAGRTLYIGSRKHSSLFVRVYEKGREQGDVNSPWVRAEIEIKNSDRVIPFDLLLRPSDYFIAAYPCLEFLQESPTPERMKVKEKKAKIGVYAAKQTIKHQFGKYLRVLRDLHDGDCAALLDELVCDDQSAWPSRLKELAMGVDTYEFEYLHELLILKWDIETGQYLPPVSGEPALAAFYR